MKPIVFALGAVALAALTGACGYTEHTQAVVAPSYERPVAVPGATYYGDAYYSPYYYPSAYVRYY